MFMIDLKEQDEVQKYGTANTLILQGLPLCTESPNMRYIPPDVTSRPRVQVGAQGAGQAQNLPGKSPDCAPIRAADRLRSEHIKARLARDVDERVAINKRAWTLVVYLVRRLTRI